MEDQNIQSHLLQKAKLERNVPKFQRQHPEESPKYGRTPRHDQYGKHRNTVPSTSYAVGTILEVIHDGVSYEYLVPPANCRLGNPSSGHYEKKHQEELPLNYPY